MMRKKWISILYCCITAVCCNAQTAGYKFYAALDSVKTSGFYNIAITPELSAHLKTDYSDLRIVNDSGKWVPHASHFPKYEIASDAASLDLKYATIENSKLHTTLIIENGKKFITNLGLVIRNTNAQRFCTISGSDDKVNWFVINDSILLNPAPDNNAATSNFEINFPPSSYHFFKVVIQNNNKDPFDIKGVIYTSTIDQLNPLREKIIQNPTTTLDQKDSGKISYVKITQQQPFHFTDITLKLSGVKYFSRKAAIYIPAGSNHSFTNPGQLLQSFTISNNSTLQFHVPLCNAEVFYLLIYNEDNLPLKVTEVNTAVYYHYITSYLEKENRYRLLLGNEAATKPNYDLNAFNTQKNDSFPFLSFQKINAFEQKQAFVTPVKSNKWILWSSIIAVLFILLLFTQKMMREVNQRKEHDSI